MYYGGIKKTDVSNGPGVRVSLFVSGCNRHCKGCHNPEAWDFDYGKPFTKETEEEIIKALRPSWIQGLSILGGEPFENEEGLIPLLERVYHDLPDKDVWIYTGYTYEEVAGRELLNLCDVLVDGAFVEELKDAGLAFRGSSNQRILYLDGGEWDGRYE